MKNPRLMQTGITIDNSKHRIVIAAHRGWSSRYPENTLAAFRAALTEDIDEIELDIHLSRDGVPVIIHDGKVERTTDGAGLVQEMTLKELQLLDAGSWKSTGFAGERIPTLEECFELLRPYPGVLLNVEIKQKTRDTVDRTMKLIERYGLRERHVITCFDADIIKYAHEAYGSRCQGFPAAHMTNYRHGPEGTIRHLYSVGVHDSLITDDSHRFYRDQGIHFWTYCPDNEEAVRKHLAAGTELMTCNEIRPASEVLQAMQLR